ncbi:MAG: Smr/MutS family protein [Pseudodesulfovibrio sp.]|uniref:Smr protein/MutS2 n=1 Tax=Pseudodesulfovibrio aespoeensis (strain ATCC 700646 / DSM 10631 / Aspo-2) TaxID=643562 RepID=E6VXZ7_PSEA9|nr:MULTISPECIES: Smr/MutS family protein [Pseudodesulfovibrio]MBU4191004.1 Smr/MutS family protein [Pseudomonadota bacterium]ADU62704.1 Smr protein/MutS2 [Pseudodesulfovibrio aespoeensis Aspo-2]MBU4244723.1 Smr/MutS family protein [Pseudomonadota bacterium]MBU4377807.1 Smr/MutS family protein [Pseudomonadota bacterium]MBU4474321.1 Smr/MutS family protein [Pseudomonadota bacterium]
MAKKRHIRDLTELKELSLAKDKKKDAYTLPYDKPKTVREDTPKPNEEAELALFQAAMQGVSQMRDDTVRKPAPKAAPAPAATPLPLDPDEDDGTYLRKFLSGEVQFELEYTDEFMYGYVRGLDIKTFQQLKAGVLSVAAHLDLHGMTSVQAREGLLFFIRESYLQGSRCVLVVTGRGINSPGGQSVLRRETETWLTHEPLKRVVLAFCTAQAKDGGAGAIYVLLRNQKKTQGKIAWDTQLDRDEA